MQDTCDDRWERTRRHLLENFLVNPRCRLSTIRELSEGESSSPESLPDLVVEPMPDQHDHPADFYERLERRMKRYYRQLFLGANDSDNDSADFEVGRSLASTVMLDTDSRRGDDLNVEAGENRTDYRSDDSIVKKRKLTNENDAMRQETKSTNKSLENDENESPEKHDDKLIDTCSTYDHTEHESADSNSSRVEDEEDPKLIETPPINESIHSDKTDGNENVNTEDCGDKQSYDKEDNQSALRKRETLKKNEETSKESSTNGDKLKKSGKALNERNASKTNETEVSEDPDPSHRISITVADVHEKTPERRLSHVSDNHSPVLIPRLLQFSRRVFGSRQGGESFNVMDASDKFIKRLSSHNADASNKHNEIIEEPETQVQRLMSASELTRASIDSEKNIDTEKTVDYSDTEDNCEKDDVDYSDTEENRVKDDIDQNIGIETTIAQSEIENCEKDDLDQNNDIENTIPQSEIENCEKDDVDYSDTEENCEKDDVDQNNDINIIQQSDITRASLDSNKTHGTEKELHHVDTKNANQDDIKNNGSDIEDKGQSENKDNDTDESSGLQNASINWNKDGIDDDENSFDNAIRKGVFTRKARKMVFISSSDDSFEDREPIAQSSAKSIDDEDVEVMREARATGGSERRSGHGEAVQDSPALAFKAQTNAVKIEDESSDSTEINAPFDEDFLNEEAIETPQNIKPHNVARIVEDFWSVSPIDVNIEELPQDRSNTRKRRTDAGEGAPSKRKKKDIAIQTGTEENSRKWEDIRTELFVGSPLVFRLCVCQDHVCS